MKCLVVGDMFIPAEIMKRKIPAGMFAEIDTLEWGDTDRAAMRNRIRNIETGGPRAEPPPLELAERVRDCDVLMVHLCPVPADIITAAPRLKVVASNRGGSENVDVPAATARKIAVITTPQHNAKAVADFAVGLMLAETRNIGRSYHALKNGVWRERFPNSGRIPELNNCRVGLIGFGTIGKLVAARLAGFELPELLVHDPWVEGKTIEAAGGRAVGKEELLRNADIVSIHSRQGPKDPPVIGRGELSLMKETAILINTARAVAVDMEALLEALREKRLGGAALDVFPSEPLAPDAPVLELDNVTVTNHRGGDTLNSYWESPAILAGEVGKYFRGDKPYYFVNPECVG